MDFGPTLACETLRELHGITVSAETLRTWMSLMELLFVRTESTFDYFASTERYLRHGECMEDDCSSRRHSRIRPACGRCWPGRRNGAWTSKADTE